MNPPTVTVLMTIYNGRAFLGEAVDSILKQTFTDYELLSTYARFILRRFHDAR